MSTNNSPNSFFDSKTIIAIAITMLIFVGWQQYMHIKYPKKAENAKKQTQEKSKQTLKEEKDEVQENKSAVSTNNLNKQPVTSSDGSSTEVKPEEKFYKFSNDLWEVKFSNYGLGLVSGRLKKYKNRDLKDKKLKNLFSTHFLNSEDPIVFDVEQKKWQLIGTYKDADSTIKKIITFNPKHYYAIVEYVFDGKKPDGISTIIKMSLKEKKSQSFLRPNYDRQEYYVYQYDGEENRSVISKGEGISNVSLNNAQIVSLGAHFFAQAIIDESSLKPNVLVYTNAEGDKAIARMDYVFSSQVKSFKIKQKYFAGPKDDVILKNTDKNLIGLINFGFFKIICYPILKILKFFYSIFSNYGVAIILLTLLMRALVFPLAYRGYKSMNGMQKIQPELKKIREKHKDDPQKANVETMALMKEHKVNPLGGCLPMVLQLPIFFALYRVLSESVVMYQAPFALWIHDLSLKDPYYVLPVLMGVTMLFQQKLTPTAMDPTQKKIMMFMPLVFAFFMVSLPSALTLYIFVSTLFGVLQQYLFIRAKN